VVTEVNSDFSFKKKTLGLTLGLRGRVLSCHPLGQDPRERFRSKGRLEKFHFYHGLNRREHNLLCLPCLSPGFPNRDYLDNPGYYGLNLVNLIDRRDHGRHPK